ncbi:MAG: PAS domain-containing sensor histidine kinase [Kofleriaceae bacterium]|nr:PAS domain-containing sensor histidine kinase [Kofleriaceae bacterium]MCB9574375.1 PAS domain-containing sensor histidine kinase [Kofleriaceae bacterium]
MTRGVRTRLFAASIALILVVGLVSTLLLRREVATTVDARLESELIRAARVARLAVESAPHLDDDAAGVLAEQLATATGARVEVFASDGAPLGTSAGAQGAHDVLGQPEVRTALGEGTVGVARRGGRVVVATPWVRADGRRGVLRLAETTLDLQPAYQRLHFLIAIAAVVGVVVALLMTLLASWLMDRAVRDLSARTRDMAMGRSRRVPIVDGDDLGDVGIWINHLADDLDRGAAALDHERAILSSVLDGVSHGVIGLDADRRITVMNEAARELLELPTVPVGEAFIDHVRLPGLVDLVRRPDRPTAVEVQSPGGARITARVVPLPTGRGCLLLLEDVTAVRRLETIRSDFVANVSHELRTPVSIIRANAETLISGAKDDPRIADRLIDGMHRNAERLTRILADLLDLSRLEAGQYGLELAAVSARAAVTQATASLADGAAARGVTVTADIAPDLQVQADPIALDQVLVNLIDNATKYNDKGGHVWVEAERRGPRIRLMISDDGPGVAPRHRERIFERFYRVDPGRSREIGGTGLGLSIVKHLVENMGGEVGVEPNEPRGTTFWVEIPAATTAHAEDSPAI